MKVLAILGSHRPNKSNTRIILQEFLKGASSQGANVETIYLKEKNINFCSGCNTCWMETPGVCIFKDDMPELLDKIVGCDILCLCNTPVQLQYELPS
jgi:multimeric flavodoxin WrbA